MLHEYTYTSQKKRWERLKYFQLFSGPVTKLYTDFEQNSLFFLFFFDK